MRAMNFSAVSVLFKKVFLPLVSFVLLYGAFNAHAIVSMENIHLGKPPQGFVGSYQLDLALETGNTEQADAATGVKLQWTEGKITDFVLANYEYGESARVTNKNKGFAHYRHIEQLDNRFAWEGFTQLSSNQFTNLTLRALAGGGVRITLGEVTDSQAFFLGLGMFYEREELDSKYPDEAAIENTLRANTYLVMKYHFNAFVSLVSTTYYQPDLSDFTDFRVIEDLSLVSKLNDALSINVAIDIGHDSMPPRDIKKTDSSVKVGIVVNF